MPQKLLTTLIIGLALLPLPGFAQLVVVEPFAPRVADTIAIERNWRTRERVIREELEFAAGDTVTTERLGISLRKIWNLQNFVSVGFRWDSLPGGRNRLVIEARDALTIYPVYGGRVQGETFSFKGGFADRNFLGRNLRLEARAQLSNSEEIYGEVRLIVPRQLLWRNMTVGFYGRAEEWRGVWRGEQLITLGNPWHQDYRYVFSPDLSIGHRMVKTFQGDQPLPPHIVPFNHAFALVRAEESVGTLTLKRHQEEGVRLSAMIGAGIGLNAESDSWLEFSLRMERHMILAPRWQLSFQYDLAGNTSKDTVLWPRIGPAQIRGIQYGELQAPLMQWASVSLFATWLDRNWLTIEQSAFIQAASAWNYSSPQPLQNRIAIGSGFRFTVPLYPAASLYLSFSWAPGGEDWFYLEL